MPPRSFHVAMWLIFVASAVAWYYFRVVASGHPPDEDAAIEAVGIASAVGLVSLKVMMTVKKLLRGDGWSSWR
jgi:hypothetical protein